MYKIGDYIVKNGSGVCRVENVMHLDMAGIDRDKLYYLLVPLNDKNEKIYVPVDSGAQRLRKVMDAEDAYDLIAKIADVQEISISNNKLREQKYKEVMKESDPLSLLCIIKTAYLQKQERLEQGKKCTAVDEYYLTMAEKMLFSELCVALEKDKEEIRNLIYTGV